MDKFHQQVSFETGKYALLYWQKTEKEKREIKEINLSGINASLSHH